MQQKFSRRRSSSLIVRLFQYFGAPVYFVLAGSILALLLSPQIPRLLITVLLRRPTKRQPPTTPLHTSATLPAPVTTPAGLSTRFQQRALRVLSKIFDTFANKSVHVFSHPFRSILSVILAPVWVIRRIIYILLAFLFTAVNTVLAAPRFLFSRPVLRYMVISQMILLSITALSYSVYTYVFADLPSPTEVKTHTQRLTTKIYDRQGTQLYNIYKDENRTLIKLGDLPPHVIQATLAIEDASFFEHPGFSPRGIVRALRTNITEGKVHGGSTITQQLVKNTLLTSEKKLRRKIREVVLAVAVDALYTKEEILEMYFNQIAYGGSTYGIEEAAQRYFGKHAAQLSIAEAALLAGVPAAPTTYSPFGTNPTLSVQRQMEVLRRMVEVGYITDQQAEAARTEELTFVEDKTDIQAPHFVMYVRSLLIDQFGEQLVSEGGLEVYTTLDLTLQNQAQQIVTTEIANLSKYRISNGAALISNPVTGEILAMVGSTDYFNIEQEGQVNLTLSSRQPGSSIKPLTYAVALEQGFTPSTSILDAPITYESAGSPPYSPKNYDGKFHGNVTLRQALANSYNIPAVKLLSTIGVNALIDRAQAMGISTWNDRSRFGLSLTLGGGEVRMIDMNTLYGVFANGGYTVPINPIVLVKDANGKVLYTNPCVNSTQQCPRTRSLSPTAAYQISDILSDNKARSAAFGTRSVLHIPDQQVAVKTGTTNSMRDNWTIGFTSNRVVSVWVGNNDNTPMSYVASGITGASPIWNALIRTQLDENRPHTFTAPDNLVKVAICAKTGTLPCAECPQVVEEYFVNGTQPTRRCSSEQFAQQPSPATPL